MAKEGSAHEGSERFYGQMGRIEGAGVGGGGGMGPHTRSMGPALGRGEACNAQRMKVLQRNRIVVYG